MESNTVDQVTGSTLIYDSLIGKINAAIEIQYTFRKVQKLIAQFADNNSDVFQTNIMGRQLLFSEKVQEELFAIFGIEKAEVIKLMKESPFFREIGASSMFDQLAYCMPIAIISGAYYAKKKVEEASFIFLLMFFKPYAARISRYFKFGVNEPQMLYTVENLNERFDLKREGTIFNLLIKMADSSFNNYAKTAEDRPTDKNLYVIATAGCYTRVNMSIQNIFRIYQTNAGKKLAFESSHATVSDDDEGDSEIDNEIRSEAAIKSNAARKVISRIMRSPVDTKLLNIAVSRGFAGSNEFGRSSQTHIQMLSNAINEMIDKQWQMLPELLDVILNSFVQQINPTTKQKYRADEIKSPVFITASLKIFKSPNSKDPNTLRTREMIEELLEKCSDDYLRFEKNSKRNLKNAFFFYLILLIRSAG